MKKVLIITYYWPPSGGAGVQRCLKAAKYLPEFGVEPVILTVDPDRASYPVVDDTLLNDVPPGLKVIRTNSFEPLNFYKHVNPKGEIPHSGFVNEASPGLFQKISRFIRGNCFIPDARKGWNNYALKEASRLIREENIDTVLISSPPHSSQLMGLKLKKDHKITWIADFRDPWTDIYYYSQMYHLPFAARKDAKLEKLVLEKADAVVVVGQSLKNLLAAKLDKSYADKFHIISNGYDEEDLRDLPLPEPGDRFTITYTGTLTPDYSPAGFFEAVARFLGKQPSARLRLRFVGRVSDELISLLSNMIPAGIAEYTGVVSHPESIACLAESAVLFLAIPRMPSNEGILTGKLFEYIGCRRPILCIGPENGDAAKIIASAKAGASFDYDNIEAITDFIEKSYADWAGNRGSLQSNDVDLTKYSRRFLAGEMAALILK